MTTSEFIKKYNPCREGRVFAERFALMSEVWTDCEDPQWLLWILAQYDPLTKNQSITLANGFADSVKHLVGVDSICAAYAARASRAASYAARAASYSADPESSSFVVANYAYLACSDASFANRDFYTQKMAQCELIRATIPNPFL